MGLTLEAFGCCFVGAFAEVTVDVEDGAYRCVAESVGDYLRMLAAWAMRSATCERRRV